MTWETVLGIAAVVLASVGSAGAIILGLSAWLGRVWANRLMQETQQQHQSALEELRADLRSRTDAELEKLRHEHHGEIDLVMRRREVYERTATAMRVFLQSGPGASDEARREFLKAYDTCFLWASDDVLEVLGQFLDVNVALGQNDDPRLRQALGALYAVSMVGMRRDAGFPETSPEKARYRLVSFGDWLAPGTGSGR